MPVGKYRSGYRFIRGISGLSVPGSVSSGAAAGNGLLNNLISYWKLDEASGTRNDSHGANHLTDNNTVTQAAGKIVNAGQFTAANSEYLSITDNASLSTGDIDFTFSFWVYADSFPDHMRIISKDDGVGDREYFSSINFADSNKFIWGRPGSTTVTWGVAPASATWYLVICWHDATADTINIQVNDGTPVSAAHAIGFVDSGDAFEIGRYGDITGAQYWNGRIDEVGFWKTVLTAAQRTSLYNGGAGLPYASFTS